jgi:hypothetical protein
LATLAMPPLASAMRRRAIRSTLGSSSSSNAALRYSAAKSGLSPPVSSWTDGGGTGLSLMSSMSENLSAEHFHYGAQSSSI